MRNADIAASSAMARMGFMTIGDYMGIYCPLSHLFPSLKYSLLSFSIPFIISLIVLYFLLEYRYNGWLGKRFSGQKREEGVDSQPICFDDME